MRARSVLGTSLVAGLALAACWNGSMLLRSHGYPPEEPTVRFALDAAGNARFANRLPMPARCTRLANLYVQAGVLRISSHDTGRHSLAVRSEEEMGVAYLDAGCPMGTLLVLSTVLREHERKVMDKARDTGSR